MGGCWQATVDSVVGAISNTLSQHSSQHTFVNCSMMLKTEKEPLIDERNGPDFKRHYDSPFFTSWIFQKDILRS